ncbi:DMT family transporter [Aliiglaciecola sp.]|nr:DMT family transporter [Aliiglaciecola sp.]
MCRYALADTQIDAASFTLIRLVSGAIILALIVGVNTNLAGIKTAGNWLGAISLFIYAASFSFAYVELDTGLGALILFTCVQLTMIIYTLARGNRLSWIEWLGLGMAFCGFVYLLSPGEAAPSTWGAMLMCCAGIAWGAYTINGKGSSTPLLDTTGNFIRASAISVLLIPTILIHYHIAWQGALLAIASGAITSGIGYAIWYLVLPRLTSTVAAVLQLTVPVIAAFGGWIMLAESPSDRLNLSAVLILLGIIVVIYAKKERRNNN